MSDIYIPELIELDSYWKRAVDDAIYDTLKGEKRLYYALSNRKKIKEKLRKLGPGTVFSRRHHLRAQTKRGKKKFFECRSESSDWESDSNLEVKSSPSQKKFRSRKARSQRKAKVSGSPGRRSRSRGSSWEKKSQNPDGPLLGNGSHEKIKKSQNSFNYEPMGSGSTVLISESEEEDKKMNGLKYKKHLNEEKKKEIEWLHVRGNDTFKDSDTDIFNSRVCKEIGDKKGFERRSTVRDMNYFMKSPRSSRATPSNETEKPGPSNVEGQKIPMKFDLQEDLFWENEVKKAIRENVNLERKLCLALAKRKILSKGTRRASNKIQIRGSLADTKFKRRKNEDMLSPFVKFYLEVYRELCKKCPVEEIPTEAITRWRDMPLEEKATYAAKTFKKKSI